MAGIQRRMEWPEPRNLTSLKELSEYTTLLYKHLTEESGLRARDISTQFQHTTTENIGGSGISTLGTAKIDDNAITSAKIKAAAVEAAEIATGAVEEAKIAADAVTATKINVAALHGTTGAIASDHIIAGMLQTDCVTEAKVLADAITATKINVAGIDGTSGSVATNHIVAGMIQTNAITSIKIQADAVTASKINVVGLDGTTGYIKVSDATAANIVTAGINTSATTLIAPGKVLISGATVLSDWSHGTDATYIDGGDVYANSITATQIDALTITAAEIASNAITGVKILADAVTATKINVVGLDGASGRIVVTDQTDADVVTAGINTHAVTLINAGKILISGAVPLSDWSHATDATLIDGGEIYTNSITSSQIAAESIIVSKLGSDISMVSAGYDAEVNMAQDASFEADAVDAPPTSGWTVQLGSPVIKAEASTATIGKQSCYFPGDGSNHRIISKQSFPVTPGQVIYGRLRAIGDADTAKMYFGLYYSDTTYAYFASNQNPGASWTTYQGSLTIPAGVTWAKIWLFNFTDNTGVLYTDDVYVGIKGAWRHGTDVTYIDGGKIYTNTITATQIAATTITASELAADAVTATKIDVAGLDGTSGRIVVGDATDADVITGGINTHATTLIAPGKVLISGAVNLDDWSHGTDATYIDGGKIYANSITVSQIAANTITVGEVDFDSQLFTDGTTKTNVEAWKHASDATLIDGGDIYALSVTVGKINSDATDKMFTDSTTKTNIEGWKHGSDVTKIDGGDIYADSITATQINAGTITATEIHAGTITADNLVAGLQMKWTSTPTTNARNNNAAEQTTVSVAYAKVKEIKINETTGKMNVRFGLLATEGTPKTVEGKMYKNGSPVGVEHSTGDSGTWQYYEDEVPACVADDLIQIYAKKTGVSEIAKVKDMALRYDRAVSLVVGQTLTTPLVTDDQTIYSVTNQDP